MHAMVIYRGEGDEVVRAVAKSWVEGNRDDLRVPETRAFKDSAVPEDTCDLLQLDQHSPPETKRNGVESSIFYDWWRCQPDIQMPHMSM